MIQKHFRILSVGWGGTKDELVTLVPRIIDKEVMLSIEKVAHKGGSWTSSLRDTALP